MKRYKIICMSCQGSRLVDLHKTQFGERIDWLEEKQDGAFTIVSGRERLDGRFGWQCVCGNNDLMTVQEKKTFTNPASPKPQEINDIVKNLVPDKPKFEMITV